MGSQKESDDCWQQLAPVLDVAMADLKDIDRNALILCLFENRSIPEVGRLMGLKEVAAQERVSGALHELHNSCSKRDVVVARHLLVGAISANSVQMAPVRLLTSLINRRGDYLQADVLSDATLRAMNLSRMKTLLIGSCIALAAMATLALLAIQFVF